MSTILLWLLSGVLAIVPVGIWIYILFKDKNHDKKILTLIFSSGILAVLIVLGLQYFWIYYPETDPFAWLNRTIQDPTYYYVGLFIIVGILEEIFKQWTLRAVDRKTILVQTINDSIRFSLAAALGFAFAENILYFYNTITEAPIQVVVQTFVFRSLFTACAHMVFSGIFGYFYGIAKFTIDITKNAEWQKNIPLGVRFMSRLFRIPYAQAFREYKILQGLAVAIILHAIFNYVLQMNYILPAVILVGVGYWYLRVLLNRKAGNLILITDIEEKRKSTMGKNDTEVVLELLGMWFKDKKFVDVIHMCERLLERDPDNNVVKLFKAKAMDKLDPENPYNKVLNTVLGDRSKKDKNTISYYKQKQEIHGKELSNQHKEKMFRFVDEKKKKDDETFDIDGV